MSRIRLDIDRLVLRGFEPLEGKALAEALRLQLSQVLCNRTTLPPWARSHCTPILKLEGTLLEAGSIGADKFARQVARAIGKGLKP